MLGQRLGLSQRRACRLVGQHRSTHRHLPGAASAADPDAPLRAELRSFARAHARWGQRRALVHVRGAGFAVNRKKLQRLWREEGLRVKQKARRKRAGASTVVVSADAPNVVWAIDFQFDATTDGRPFKIANIIDEHTREALGGQIARSITGEDLVAELGRIAEDRGSWPAAVRCDNGPELICAALADWCGDRVGITFIDPGCPWQNPWIESFNGRLRDECLNLNHFALLLEARVVVEDWRQEYNHLRPHSSLGYRTPASYAAGCTHQHHHALSETLDR
jgi:putative transposase